MPATRSDSSEAFRGRLRRQRKSGSTHPKIGQPSAHLNYPATLHSFRSCLKVIDTFRDLVPRTQPERSAVDRGTHAHAVTNIPFKDRQRIFRSSVGLAANQKELAGLVRREAEAASLLLQPFGKISG